eukprot:TRINITY_DN4832_c0_g1_i1.p1 TRINITY_DN4832_c0_g1~~TRINITY_DN4832_c0_g1_i1.p1  ORF type:complete len:620 (+),score=150.89 TRINITY_DN4832_c0_g1_i1:105-1862(+)
MEPRAGSPERYDDDDAHSRSPPPRLGPRVWFRPHAAAAAAPAAAPAAAESACEPVAWPGVSAGHLPAGGGGRASGCGAWGAAGPASFSPVHYPAAAAAASAPPHLMPGPPGVGDFPARGAWFPSTEVPALVPHRSGPSSFLQQPAAAAAAPSAAAAAAAAAPPQRRGPAPGAWWARQAGGLQRQEPEAGQPWRYYGAASAVPFEPLAADADVSGSWSSDSARDYGFMDDLPGRPHFDASSIASQQEYEHSRGQGDFGASWGPGCVAAAAGAAAGASRPPFGAAEGIATPHLQRPRLRTETWRHGWAQDQPAAAPGAPAEPSAAAAGQHRRAQRRGAGSLEDLRYPSLAAELEAERPMPRPRDRAKLAMALSPAVAEELFELQRAWSIEEAMAEARRSGSTDGFLAELVAFESLKRIATRAERRFALRAVTERAPAELPELLAQASRLEEELAQTEANIDALEPHARPSAAPDSEAVALHERTLRAASTSASASSSAAGASAAGDGAGGEAASAGEASQARTSLVQQVQRLAVINQWLRGIQPLLETEEQELEEEGRRLAAVATAPAAAESRPGPLAPQSALSNLL